MNRAMRLTLVVALAAMGCKGDDTDLVDTDVVDTDDTDVPVEPDVSFANPNASEDAVVSLTWVDLRSFETEPVVGAALAAAPFLDGEAGFVLDAPGPDDLIEVDPETYPGLKLAFYIPTTHIDVDGDGAHGAEPIVAVGNTWILWVEGEPPADLAAVGFVAGWNGLLAPLAESDGPVAAGHIGVPLPENLRASETLGLGGDVMFEFPTSARLAAVSVLEGNDTPIVDLKLADPWSMTFAGRPPVAWLSPLEDGFGLLGAVAFPMAYDDVDASGSLGDGDAWIGNACLTDGSGDHTVVALWIDPPADVISALFLTIAGFGGPGWNAFAIDGDVPVPIGDGLDDIAMTGDCGRR